MLLSSIPLLKCLEVTIILVFFEQNCKYLLWRSFGLLLVEISLTTMLSVQPNLFCLSVIGYLIFENSYLFITEKQNCKNIQIQCASLFDLVNIIHRNTSNGTISFCL